MRVQSFGPVRKLSGVVFDMDGTLTHLGSIDFAAMRSRAGIPHGADILSHIGSLQPHARAQAEAVVLEEEMAGLARMRLREDCAATLIALARSGLQRGLLTRNNDAAVVHCLSLLTSEAGGSLPDGAPYFSMMLTRSFEPPKPSAAPLLHIAKEWGIAASEVIMVGDSDDDIQAARAAGAIGVLIGDEDEAARAHAHFHISELSELQAVIAAVEGRELI